MDDLVIPRQLRETAVAWEGEPARAWLAALPGIVAAVGDDWDLDVGPPFEPGGKISWVAPVLRRTDGAELVLKVQMPHPESDPEAVALAAWDGHGAVRLHRYDPDWCALLLERCEPGTDLHRARDVAVAFDAAVALVRELQAVAVPAGVPDLEAYLTAWADRVEARRGLLPDVDGDVWALVLATMRGAGRTGGRVLLHGDLNPTNVLASARGWLAIDPKPMVGEPAFDAARTILQLAPEQGLDPPAAVGARIRRSAAALGLDPVSIATWCLVDIVGIASFAAVTDQPAESRRLLGMVPWVLPSLG